MIIIVGRIWNEWENVLSPKFVIDIFPCKNSYMFRIEISLQLSFSFTISHIILKQFQFVIPF